MNKTEVIKLMLEIKRSYPNVDVSDDEIDRHAKYLRDIPYGVAIENLDSHVLTSKWPPTIAELRGGLGEQLERNRSQESTEEFFEQLEEFRRNAAPPPKGLGDRVRAMLRG